MLLLLLLLSLLVLLFHLILNSVIDLLGPLTVDFLHFTNALTYFRFDESLVVFPFSQRRHFVEKSFSLMNFVHQLLKAVPLLLGRDWTRRPGPCGRCTEPCGTAPARSNRKLRCLRGGESRGRNSSGSPRDPLQVWAASAVWTGVWKWSASIWKADFRWSSPLPSIAAAGKQSDETP